MEVPRVKIESLRRSTPLPHEKTVHRVSFSLTLEGCFVVDRMYADLDRSAETGEKGKFTYQRDDKAMTQFCEYPAQHYKGAIPTTSLGEYIALAVNDFFNETEVCDFLDNRIDNSEFFRPHSWPSALKIPVYFLRFRGLSECHGVVLANVSIGHHVKLNRVPLYPKNWLNEIILNKDILSITNRVLDDDDVQKEIISCITGVPGFSSMGDFQTSVQRFNGIPPVKFC